MSNLLAAGRCVSADHDALASIRVMGPSLALGEAAGTAAALLGAIQFGVGAIVSPVVGLLGNDAVAIGIVVVCALSLAIVVLVTVVRPWQLPDTVDVDAPAVAH